MTTDKAVMTRQPWIDWENEYLKAAWPTGILIGEITKRLRRTEHSIRRQVCRLGLIRSAEAIRTNKLIAQAAKKRESV